MTTISLLLRVAVLCLLLWLAVVDVRERRLPTKWVLVVGLAFCLDAGMAHMPLATFAGHLGLAFGVFAFCALLFAARMLGGGDAKLAAMIFLWTGPTFALFALALISVLGTVVSVISFATRKMPRQQPGRIRRGLAMFSSMRGVPYGVALACGGGTTILLPALLPLLLKP